MGRNRFCWLSWRLCRELTVRETLAAAGAGPGCAAGRAAAGKIPVSWTGSNSHLPSAPGLEGLDSVRGVGARRCSLFVRERRSVTEAELLQVTRGPVRALSPRPWLRGDFSVPSQPCAPGVGSCRPCVCRLGQGPGCGSPRVVGRDGVGQAPAGAAACGGLLPGLLAQRPAGVGVL